MTDTTRVLTGEGGTSVETLAAEMLERSGARFDALFVDQDETVIQQFAELNDHVSAQNLEELGQIFESTWPWIFEKVVEKLPTLGDNVDPIDATRAAAVDMAIQIAGLYQIQKEETPGRPFSLNGQRAEVQREATTRLFQPGYLAGIIEAIRTDVPEPARPVFDEVPPKPKVPKPKTPYRSKGIRPSRREERAAEEDSVRRYLVEIGEYPLLKQADEVRLAKIIEAGVASRELAASPEWKQMSAAKKRPHRKLIQEAEEAERTFVQSNLRLVVSIAKRYTGRGLPLLDLVQEGNLGLMHAVEKFDYTKGFKFSTYATWWIRHSIDRGIASTARTIRVPVHEDAMMRLLTRRQADFEIKHNRTPTIDELAEVMELKREKVVQLLRQADDAKSLEFELGHDGDWELKDIIPDQNAVDPAEAVALKDLPEQIEKMLRELDDRSAEIVRLRFGLRDGEARKLEEIGEQFGVTRERIRQIESRALSRLRHPSNPGCMLFLDHYGSE